MALPLTKIYGSVQTLRCQMGTAPRQTSCRQTKPQRRQATSERSSLFRGNPLDAPHRSPVARTSQGVRLGFNMLAQTPRMGKERDAARPVARVSFGTLGRAENQMGRMFCGRELRFRQKGGSAVGKTKRGKGTKWMVLVDGQGLPLGVSLQSATPAEVKLAPGIKREVKGKPTNLVADRAYDSNTFRAYLKTLGIEPIIPARINNRQATDQDGRKLRRYRHRWIIERTFSWLGWCRRLVVRWDHSLEMYQGFFHIALIMLTLRRVLK